MQRRAGKSRTWNGEAARRDGTSRFALDFEILVLQRLEYALNVLDSSGFQDQLNFSLADGHMAETASVTDLQDIGACIGDPLRELRESAGTVRNHR
jgi:hypothetical protein